MRRGAAPALREHQGCMVHTRALSLLVAVACAVPGWAAGQRVAPYQPLHEPFGSYPSRQLRLAGTAPVRIPWPSSDAALASGFAAALLIDAAQTRRLARSGWRDYYETNPILGPRPSVGRVNTYTAVVGLTVLGVAAVAPKRARPWVLGVALAVEAFALAAMSRNGVAIRFP